MGYLTLGDLDPFEMVKAAAAAGFEATGLRLTGHRPGDAWPFDPANPEHVARMGQVAAREGIAIANVCTYRFTPETDPADYAPVLRACRDLGIGTMIANAACADMRLTARNLGAVADIAAECGVRIALEFIPVSTVPDLAAASAIVEAAGRPNLGIAVDALHLRRSGGVPGDLARVPEERLYLVQLCDGPAAAPQGEELYREMRAGRLLPGEGAFDLAALLRAMPAAAEIEVEVPNADYAHLGPVERAARVRLGTMAFLESLKEGAR
jgi:sugar phosphate isomerase/epimerase